MCTFLHKHITNTTTSNNYHRNVGRAMKKMGEQTMQDGPFLKKR